MERSGESAHTSRQLLEMADLNVCNEGGLCLIAAAQIGKRAAQQGELR